MQNIELAVVILLQFYFAIVFIRNKDFYLMKLLTYYYYSNLTIKRRKIRMTPLSKKVWPLKQNVWNPFNFIKLFTV